ncbi:MAG: hypothetical protein GX027_03140 [Clostridiaceae bacterium]|jgi:hypothetical protein|nr:hypothetical protein [Clostridiaceae bacterium]
MSINRLGSLAVRLAVVLLCLAAVLQVPVPVFAEQQSKVLFTLEQTRNMAIRIGYETEVPIISFIGPDGTEYIEGKTPESIMTVEHVEGAVYYYIRNAAPGDWTIVYDKLSNKNLYVDSAPYNEPIVIEEFTLEEVRDDRADISFMVSYYQDDYYDYIVYAAITDEYGFVSGQKELKHGNARANKPVSDTVSLTSLTSYDNYRLMLEVYIDSHGIESLDTRLADDTLSYSNRNTPRKIEDFYVEVDLTDESLLIDWSSWAVNCDEYIVAVFDPGDLDEPSFLTNYTPDITSTELLIDSSWEYVRIELAYVKNGITSEIRRKEIRFDTGVEIAITTEEHTNSAQAVIQYNVPGSVEATVTVNDSSETVMLSGSGYFSVPIGRFENEITVSYFPEENVCFVIRKEIFTDRIAPMLKLYENSSSITVPDAKYTLAGETEPDCTLTVNGANVPLNPDGTFLYELTLSQGKNEFTVVSTDPAGNSTKQTVIINQAKAVAGSGDEDTPFYKRYKTLLVTFAMSMVFIALVLLFAGIHSKQAEKGKGRKELLLLLMRNCAIALTIMAGLIALYLFISRSSAAKAINSPEYYELVLDSAQDAYDAIMTYRRIHMWFIISSITAGTGLLLTLMFGLMLGQARKRQTASAGVTCPNCGRHYNKPVGFCATCGTRMDSRT